MIDSSNSPQIRSSAVFLFAETIDRLSPQLKGLSSSSRFSRHSRELTIRTRQFRREFLRAGQLFFSRVLPPAAITNALLALAGDDHPQTKITAIDRLQSPLPRSMRRRGRQQSLRVRERLAAVITRVYAPQLNSGIVSLVFDDGKMVIRAALAGDDPDVRDGY